MKSDTENARVPKGVVMTAHTVSLTMNLLPDNCGEASYSEVSGQDGLDLTLYPSDTVSWNLSSNVKGVTATFQGIKIFSPSVSSLSGYLVSSSSKTLTNASCSNVDLDFTGTLEVRSIGSQGATHATSIAIAYQAWFQTDEATPRIFYLYGQLSLAPATLIEMQAASQGGTLVSPPSSNCCKCGVDVGGDPLPATVDAETAIAWGWDQGNTWPGTTTLMGLQVTQISEAYDVGHIGVHTPAPQAEPLSSFFSAPHGTGSFGCTCTSPAVYYPNDASKPSYPASNGVIQFNIGPLAHLTGVPGLLDDVITLTYTVWFTYKPANGNTLWWAYDPDMVMEREGDTGPGYEPKFELGKLRLRVKS